MPRSRLAWAPRYRRRMVELVRAGRPPQDLAREFEPSAQAIHSRVVQAELDKGRRADGPSTRSARSCVVRCGRTGAQRELRATVTDLLAEDVAVTPVTALCVDIHYEMLTEWPPSTG